MQIKLYKNHGFRNPSLKIHGTHETYANAATVVYEAENLYYRLSKT